MFMSCDEALGCAAFHGSKLLGPLIILFNYLLKLHLSGKLVAERLTCSVKCDKGMYKCVMTTSVL